MQASPGERHFSGNAVDDDAPFLRQQKERNAEEDQIHHWKIPERAGRTGESSEPNGFDDGKGHEEQQERDAKTEKRREFRPAPGQFEPLLLFFGDDETESIADRFELRRVALHIKFRVSCSEFRAPPLKSEVLQAFA